MAEPKLSLCMIVRDEEQALPRCLASVRELVGEIIVVDTGSSDRTVEIARSFGAAVVRSPWRGDFSASRNLSLEKAAGEWILCLDADEELTVRSKEDLAGLLADQSKEGYFVQVINFLREGEDGGEILKHPAVRLFRNRSEYRFSGALHEQVLPSILRLHPREAVGNAESITINHFGYTLERMRSRNKPERNLEMARKMVSDHPEDCLAHYHLAVSYFELERFAEALAEFRIAFRGFDPRVSYFPTVTRNLAVCLIELKCFTEALSVLSKGKKAYPGYTDLWYLEGLARFRLRQYRSAAEAMLGCLSLGETPSRYVSSLGVGSFKAHYLIGQIMEEAGEAETAIEAYIQAWQGHAAWVDPIHRIVKLLHREGLGAEAIADRLSPYLPLNTSRGLVILADTLFGVKEYATALVYINRAFLLGPPAGSLLLFRGRCLLALDRTEEALEAYDEIRKDDPLYTSAAIDGCLASWCGSPPRRADGIIESLGACQDDTGPRNSRLIAALEVFNRVAAGGSSLLASSPGPGPGEPGIFFYLAKRFQDLGKQEPRDLAVRLATRGLGPLEAGKVCFHHELFDPAARIILSAFEEGSWDAESCEMVAEICCRRALLEEAEKLFGQALLLEPHRVQAARGLARVYLQRAQELLVKGCLEHPDEKSLELRLGAVSQKLASLS
ncbi:MAG: glycosyltransferase [Firmicutes bacterium]|nr:glycosyltransferase [Bacillota bacterium]